jgi:hypothetical protein
LKTHLYSYKVFKVPGKLGFNGSVIVNKKGEVDLDLYGFGEFYYGWYDSLPENNWLNLWNSKPYKP